MKIGFFLSLFLIIQGCASKTVETTSTKKENAVISVFDQESKPAEKTTAPAQVVTPAPATPQVAASTTTATAMTPNHESPKEVIQSYTNELRSLRIDETQKKKKRDKQIAEKVRKFFDFRSLAQLSLGSYWSGLNPKKQEEFSDLFTRLIEKSYLSKSKNLVGDYQVSYGNEIISGNKATVASNVSKDDADFEITYELHKNPNDWMIYNIIFDQVNLVQNYQSQFNKIIAKSGIDELMKMMRKKLNENSSDVDEAL